MDSQSPPEPCETHARTFFRFLDSRGYGVSLDGLREYFAWLEGQGYRASTVRIKRQAAIDRVRRLFAIPGAASPEQVSRMEWAISELCRENRAPKLQFQSVGREKVLSVEDYRKALGAAILPGRLVFFASSTRRGRGYRK